MRSTLTLASALFLLAGGIALQIVFALKELPPVETRRSLALLIPSTLAGYHVTDEKLGQTEVSNEAVLKTLNLDDYVHRRFSKDGLSFTIYAAYWAAGRMPSRLVASHTPDRCWTANGMRCVDMRFRHRSQLDGKPLLPAEVRTFTPATSSDKTFVAYWHTVDGKLYDYGGRFNAVPHPWLWWKDTIAQAAYGSREQLFVRIASETPFEQLWKDNGFQAVMKTVADLGLWEAAVGP